jgi:hypothetical protein
MWKEAHEDANEPISKVRGFCVVHEHGGRLLCRRNQQRPQPSFSTFTSPVDLRAAMGLCIRCLAQTGSWSNRTRWGSYRSWCRRRGRVPSEPSGPPSLQKPRLSSTWNTHSNSGREASSIHYLKHSFKFRTWSLVYPLPETLIQIQVVKSSCWASKQQRVQVVYPEPAIRMRTRAVERGGGVINYVQHWRLERLRDFPQL